MTGIYFFVSNHWNFFAFVETIVVDRSCSVYYLSCDWRKMTMTMTTNVIACKMIDDNLSGHGHYYHDDNVLCRWIGSDSFVFGRDHRTLVAMPNDSDDV